VVWRRESTNICTCTTVRKIDMVLHLVRQNGDSPAASGHSLPVEEAAVPLIQRVQGLRKPIHNQHVLPRSQQGERDLQRAVCTTQVPDMASGKNIDNNTAAVGAAAIAASERT